MQRLAGIAERRLAPRRIPDAPEKSGRLAVAAAVEETADPSAGMRQRNGGGADIENADNIELLPVSVNPESRDRQQKAAVKYQPPLIDPDNPPEVIAILVEKLNNVKDSRADNPGNHRDEKRRGSLVGGHLCVTAVLPEQPGGGEKSNRGHQTVAAEREAPDLQKDRMHEATSPLRNVSSPVLRRWFQARSPVRNRTPPARLRP